MKKAELALRRQIVAACQEMHRSGLSEGTTGNMAARFEDRALVTPSATPYETLEPTMMASMPLSCDDYGRWEGPLPPSTEWRFHLDILKARPEVQAVVHTHSTYCTALAMARKEIPAAHYMVAAFGGATVRCSDYATFGSKALSETALMALTDRTACLLANHGMIVLGESLAKAMWRAVELETIARQYYLTLAIGGPVVLTAESIDATLAKFDGYGLANSDPAPRPNAKKKRRTKLASRR